MLVILITNFQNKLSAPCKLPHQRTTFEDAGLLIINISCSFNYLM